MYSEKLRITKLRDQIIKYILKNIPNSHLNGHPKNRLFNNVNVRFDYIEGESLMMDLDAKGIEVSTVSACASSKLQFSHVLIACGIEETYAQGTIRISLGRYTTQKDVDYFLKVLPKSVEKMRKISPMSVTNWTM